MNSEPTPFRQHSEVSPSRSGKTRYAILFFSIIMLIFISIMIFEGGHASRPVERVNVPEWTDNFRSELAANMTKLSRLNRQTTEISPAVSVSKSFLVRQNAPTRAYLTHAIATNRKPLDRMLARQLPHPDFVIPQGEFIHAVLETAINSDLPGMLRAVVTRPVYGYIGDRLLIPQGTRLIGEYSSKTLQGINRVLVIWHRLILPNGISVQLDSSGVDTLGRSGKRADHVNSHFFARFGEAALLSLIGAGAANVSVGNQNTYTAAQQYRTAIAQSFAQSASASLQTTRSMKPTLSVHQGDLVNVFVAHDLDFSASPLAALPVRRINFPRWGVT